MKVKSRKTALILSSLSLLLCFAMLIGSTFAWFTDTASTGVSTITSGNLHVEIQNEAGKKIENLEWVAADDRAQDKILWEPGATYTLTPFKIVNTGNLALKYKLVVTGLDGDSELLDVIDFTYTYANGTTVNLDAETPLLPGKDSGMITVSATMDKTAGNEYMDKTLSGIGITVYATQDTVEADSFGDQYDKDAQYPAMVSEIKAKYGVDGLSMPDGVKIAKAADGVNGHFDITLEDEEAFLYFTQVFNRQAALDARTEALNNGTATRYEGESDHNPLNIWYYSNAVTLKMGCDIDLHGATVNPFSFGTGIYFDGQGHTIKNAKLSATSGKVGFFAGGVTPSNVVFDNIQVSATGCDCAGVVFGSTNTNITNVTVKNCSVTGGYWTGGIVGYNYGDVTNCVVENTVVSGQYKVGGIVGYLCSDNSGEHRNVIGNTLADVTVKGENIWAGKSLVIGKLVGNWNAASGSTGTCSGNTFSGTTTATENIGLKIGDVTEN